MYAYYDKEGGYSSVARMPHLDNYGGEAASKYCAISWSRVTQEPPV
jgi:hypothetical protein